MTRMQEMSLDYHFTVEQEVGSSTYAFFGFNGKINHCFDLCLNIFILYYSINIRIMAVPVAGMMIFGSLNW